MRGAAITLAIAALSLILAAIAADRLKQIPLALAFLRFLPFVLAGFAGWLLVFKPLRAKISDEQVARLIEERCLLEDRLLRRSSLRRPHEASPRHVTRLIKDTGERCSVVSLERVVDPRQAYAYGTASALIMLALLASMFIGPEPLTSGMAALYSTAGDGVSANAMFINVSPGTSRAPRGSDQKIKAALSGFDAERSQVFIRKLNSESWIATPMEPAKNYGEFQHIIFNIQDSVAYYIEANGIRSPEFTLEVADLPSSSRRFIAGLSRIPRLASRSGDGGEVAALKGTVV